MLSEETKIKPNIATMIEKVHFIPEDADSTNGMESAAEYTTRASNIVNRSLENETTVSSLAKFLLTKSDIIVRTFVSAAETRTARKGNVNNPMIMSAPKFILFFMGFTGSCYL